MGPGTPGGELLRRYWHPIMGSSALKPKQVMAVRLMGENLVLFRDAGGKLGLVEPQCAHRRVDRDHVLGGSNLLWALDRLQPEVKDFQWICIPCSSGSTRQRSAS